MKNIRKIAAILVSAAMAMSVVAFAQSDDKGLTDAVVAVKKVVEISEEYEKFNYSNYENNGMIFWNLDWNSDNGYIGATVVNNTVSEMYSNAYDEKQNGIAVISLEEAKAKADEFLKKVMPDKYSLMKIVSDSEIIKNSGNYEYAVNYKMYVNEIPVQGRVSRVGINKTSGRVSSYSRGFYEKEPIEFESLDGVIPIEEALGKFTENIGFELKYNLYRDYKEKTVTAKPVYAVNGVGTLAIDAKTGEKYEIPTDENYRMYGGSGGAVTMNAAKDEAAVEESIKLSPQELEAVEKVKDLLSREEAEKFIKQQIPSDLPKTLNVRNSHLNKNYYDDDFVWSLTFADGDNNYYMNASVDAKTGKLISFSKSTKENKTHKKITQAEAKTIVEKYIKTVRGDEFADCEYQEELIYPVMPLKNGETATPEVLDFYSFNFVRKINGIKCHENYISVAYDNNNGEICSFNFNWNKNTEFPSIEAVKKDGEIAAVAKEKCKFALTYLTNGKPVYVFETDAVFDAFTAEILDYNGKVKTEEYTPVMYNDIAGHWCEDIIKKLFENGVYKNAESFNPDAHITQREALAMIAPSYRQQDDEKLYEWATQNGYIEESAKNPEAAISKKEAAKFFAVLMNYGEVASKYEIFNYPFSDACPEEYKGYVAICKGFGIINGNGDGTFCPDNNVTNAEFACMMYKYKSR